MDNSSFVESFQELNQRFIKLVGDLSSLRELSALDLNASNEQELLNQSIRILLENNDYERCSVFLLQDDRLVCATGIDWPDLLYPEREQQHQPREFRLGEGIMGLAAETGNLQHCHDCGAEPRFSPHESKPFAGDLICVPIIHAGRTLGVVNVSHAQANTYTNHHEHLLQIFANFLGQLLSNWRYANRMEQQIRQRTHELEHALVEAEELKRRYQHLSIVDELTGLNNRRFFFPEAHASLANSVRHRHDFSIMMIDLDHFKIINDQHGHAIGDKVLQVTAALLKGQTREGDILARFGGEEFVMALPSTDWDGTLQLADRILATLRGISFSSGNEEVRVTASIGISSLNGNESPDQPDLLETLLRQADQALYFSKANGRDQSCQYRDIPLTN